MKAFLLITFLSFIFMISCHKANQSVPQAPQPPAGHSDTVSNTPSVSDTVKVGPKDSTGLQGYKWYLDSVIVLRVDTVAQRTYYESPNYDYVVYHENTFTRVIFYNGNKSTDVSTYQYTPPGKIYFWNDHIAQINNYYDTIQLLTDKNLATSHEFHFNKSTQKIIYYRHAQ